MLPPRARVRLVTQRRGPSVSPYDRTLRRGTLRVLVLYLCMLTALPCRMGAQSPLRSAEGNVRGTVSDAASGRAIVGAVVSLTARTVVTDSAGAFVVGRVPHGEAELVVGHPRYA